MLEWRKILDVENKMFKILRQEPTDPNSCPEKEEGVAYLCKDTFHIAKHTGFLNFLYELKQYVFHPMGKTTVV
jgi:hypothetical protein